MGHVYKAWPTHLYWVHWSVHVQQQLLDLSAGEAAVAGRVEAIKNGFQFGHQLEQVDNM